MDDIEPVLDVYQLLGGGPKGVIRAVKVARYRLPAVADSVFTCRITCRADPSPWAPRPRDPLHGSSDEEQKQTTDEDRKERVWPEHGPPPFAPLPSNRIIVLSLSMVVRVTAQGPGGVLGMQMESRSFTVFVKAETLLEAPRAADGMLGPDADADVDVDVEPVDVPWKEWGPQHTRFLSESPSNQCVCYVYGLKYCRCEFLFFDRSTVQV